MQTSRPQLPRILAAALIAAALTALSLLAAGQSAMAGLSPALQAKANAALLGLWTNGQGFYKDDVPVAAVKSALATGAGVNVKDSNGRTSLMFASGSNF